jgi:predicted MFS family arabinose efflux permease
VRLLPDAHGEQLDVAGAVTVTSSLMLAVYAIVNGNEAGWASMQTLILLAAAAALLATFITIESRVQHPLMPLGLFRLRNVAISNVAGVLWPAAMFPWFFISALYMQLVLGNSPLQVGLAFLPANLIMASFSLGLSAKIVMRFGIRLPIAVGLLLAAAGLGLFSLAPVNGNFIAHILPGMLLLGIGAGMALNPVLLAAMSDVEPGDSGLASGMVNTSFMLGGALGLALLASIASAHTHTLLDSGSDPITALNHGYHWAFFMGAPFALGAGLLGGIFLRIRKQARADH